MEIRTSSFCSLSRSTDWQSFLKEIAPDLNRDLLKTLSSRQGCRLNSHKMLEIYHELERRGFKNNLETFLKRRFPWIIKAKTEPTRQVIDKRIKEGAKVRAKQKAQDWGVLNKHEVFGSYRPDILSFPQKFIIVDSPKAIFHRVKDFIKDKLAVDYIIVEDHAYIEYFDAKFAAVVDKVPRESREIYKYRQKMQHERHS